MLYWIKLVMDAMLLLSKTFCASWSIGLATALLAAVPSGHIATAENMVGGTSPAHSLDAEGLHRTRFRKRQKIPEILMPFPPFDLSMLNCSKLRSTSLARLAD